MANSQEFTIGSVVTFKSTETGERFQGIVSRINPQQQETFIGIKNAVVWGGVDGLCKLDSGTHKFSLNKITELRVIRGPRTNTNQDGKNNKQDDGSSSKKTEGKM